MTIEDSLKLHVLRRTVDRALAAAERVMRADPDSTVGVLPNPEAVGARARPPFIFAVQSHGSGGAASGQVEVWPDQPEEGLRRALLACLDGLRSKGAPESS